MKRGTAKGLVQLALAGSLAAWAANAPLGASHDVIWTCLSIFYLHALDAARQPLTLAVGRFSFVKGDLLFLVFSYLLFYFPYQLYVLGLDDIWYSRFIRRTYVQYTNPSLLAITSGVVAFCAGLSFSIGNSVARLSEGGDVENHRQFHDAFLLLVVALLVLAVGAYAVTGGLATVSTGAYSGSSTLDRTQDGIYFLATLFSMLAIAGALFRRWKFRRLGVAGILAISVAAGWALLLLALGDRNSFLLIGIVGACALSTYIFPIGRLKLLVLFMVAMTGYNVIEISRQSNERGLSAISEAWNEERGGRYSDSSFTNTTVTSRAAFALVPNQYPYFLGKFKAIGIAGILPYSRGLIVSSNDPFITSADLLSKGVLGNNPSWSLGTNVFSDIYVDFGVVGIPVLMLIVGVGFGFLTNQFRRRPGSLLWALLYLLSVALVAELPRYSFDFPIRPIVWTVLLVAAYRLLWSGLNRRWRD